MPVQSPPAPPQIQHFVNSITARLAQLAKDPPDLLVYLRAHAECVTAAFKPAGFAYEMQTGTGFQRVLHGNLDSLGYKDFPEQENAFQRAIRAAAEQRRPVVLQPHSEQASRQHGLSVEDSPAPDELPIFNRTTFEQMFIPIPNGEVIAGVLHIWFAAGSPTVSQTRVTLLRQICSEIELYLKARRARDVSHEVTRLSTYSRLLEELAGDMDLESVGWNLVNFAREAVSCERVCLFIASNYNRALAGETFVGGLEYEFELQACSGLKKPHPKSEQAGVLQRAAQKLTQLSLDRSGPAASATDKALPAGAKDAAGNKPAAPVPMPAEAARPKPQIILMVRDPAKTPTRPPEVNEYFDVMPMNWATVIPLFDRQQRVCGILFFEGVKVEEKLANSLRPMLDLSVAAGRALGTALYCTQNRPMLAARRLVALRQQLVDTPARRKWARVGLPVLLFVALMIFPIEYRIKGNASVLAVRQTTLPALVANARLEQVLVRESESVRAGQVLARFDTRDLELQLNAIEQELERSLLESDAALNAGNESQMQIARLNADKAAAVRARLRDDIARATVRAPFDGVVLGAQTLSTRIGEVLRVGEPVLQVIEPTAWQVKARLRERDLIHLDETLRERSPIPASLRLAANPAHDYALELTEPSQLAYGLDTRTGDYEFTVMLPLQTSPGEDAEVLKSGFTGRIAFDTGRKPVAYVLFSDFINFLKVRFL